MKTHFTRKNFISLALIYFYLILVVLAGLLCDATNPLGIKESMNFVKQIGLTFGFPAMNGSLGGWILVCCFLIYILLFSAAFIYEMRLAKYYNDKIFTKKWVLVYVATFFITFGLAITIGMVAQYPYDSTYIGASFLFLLQAIVVGLVIYAVLGTIVLAICGLYVNIKNIDKPFKWFGDRAEAITEMEKENQQSELEMLEEQGKLAESFGEVNENTNISAIGGSAGGGSGAGNSNGVSADALPLGEKERVFPGLCTIDYISESFRDEEFNDNVDLATLCHEFRNYLARNEKLYFDIGTIRSFISGLAASRLIILEGLSGTGKSSLARYFSEFIGESSYFEAVQATWRDRTSILGYYNDFSKTYNETEFLKRLYQASFKENNINIMVLDELNISRVEYYFADFLSVLEYPVDKWVLKIMQLPYDFETPKHLTDGVLKIPANTWFIGTANKDDSTYTITDKVYDRAITISFDDRNDEFAVTEEVKKHKISFNGLTALFNKAINNKAYGLTDKDRKLFKVLTDFTYDKFDLTFGNRINHQIDLLTPVYVACGGKKEDALDFMFSRKVVAKLSGRFEDYVKQGLIDLKTLITKTYGNEEFPKTIKEINKLLRKL